MAEMTFKVSLEEFGKRAAEYALDEITYNDLTIRQWADKIASGEFQPVRHGRWENPTESKPRVFERTGHTFTERQCSECGRWNISVTGSITCKYCPNCGAKMGR